jgi:coproporphyrinogen III oxidase-like Fe-S oxidoreductase
MRARDLVRAIGEVLGAEPGGDLALYVHVPFCASKCHFCDWVVDVPVSRLRSGSGERAAYVDALCRQIRFYGPVLTGLGYRPTVMYWGGGTPTRLDPAELTRIHAALDSAFDLAGLRQWTVETTPNDLSAGKVATLRALGVDRMSVGAQSFSAAQLRRSGRAHTAEQIEQAVHLLRAGGIDNFNIDLISSFPGEDGATLRAGLLRALRLDPPHVSVYPYRATPKTITSMQLERRTLQSWTPASMIESYELAMDVLGAAGYHEYCHGYWVRTAEHEDLDGNHKYDLAGDKIGFGSGAESILGQHLLWNENARYPEYLQDPCGFSSVRRFTADDPEMLTAPVGGALMTRDGVVYERLRRLTGLDFPALRETPYLRNWLDVLQECGARFVEGPASLRLHPDTIHETYINHLAFTSTAGFDVARA